MVKMIFPFEVKYLGKYYSSNEIIEVNKDDEKELVALGGKVAAKFMPSSTTTKTKRGQKNDTT